MVPSTGQRPCHLTSPTTTRSSFARTSILRFDADSSTQDGLSTAGSHQLSNGGALGSMPSGHGTPDSVFEGEYSHRRSGSLATNVPPILRGPYVPSCECGQAPTTQATSRRPLERRSHGPCNVRVELALACPRSWSKVIHVTQRGKVSICNQPATTEEQLQKIHQDRIFRNMMAVIA